MSLAGSAVGWAVKRTAVAPVYCCGGVAVSSAREVDERSVG
jgi:hypothetical protein